MPVTHAFVSTVEDVTDDSLVRPSDWNDEHVVENLTVNEFASPNASQWTNDSQNKQNMLTQVFLLMGG